jgi:hypothetical protein
MFREWNVARCGSFGGFEVGCAGIDVVMGEN